MRKVLKGICICLLSMVFLVACNQQADDDMVKSSDEDVIDTPLEESPEEEPEKVEDQLNLVLGDTGLFDTTLGTYEVTLEEAELLGDKLDGTKTRADNFILLTIALKNTSEETHDIVDLIGSLEVTDNLEGSGYRNISGSFDSIEDFMGEVEPGEEKSGQYLVEVYDSDEYYVRESSGNVAGGGSNQVIWTIPANEVE